MSNEKNLQSNILYSNNLGKALTVIDRLTPEELKAIPRDHDHLSVLDAAVLACTPSLVDKILAKGIDVNEKGGVSSTLHHAAMTFMRLSEPGESKADKLAIERILGKLISKGANAEEPRWDGLTVYEAAEACYPNNPALHKLKDLLSQREMSQSL